MKIPPVEYRRAHDSQEATALLAYAGEDAKILAGGQSLVPLMSFRLARPSVLIDLNPAQDMAYVREQNGHLAIGAMTRQRTLERDDLVRRLMPLLPAVLSHVGHVTNRNRGTIGGSIAHADPGAELPTLLMALGGEVVVKSQTGTRTLTAAELFIGPLMTSLAFDEVITEVRLPKLPDNTGIGVEELARRHGDFAIAAAVVAVHLDPTGRLDLVRIGVGGVGSTPLRLLDAEGQLAGATGTAAELAAAAEAAWNAVDPMDDVHASSSYRKDMVRVLVRRALESALSEVKERQP